MTFRWRFATAAVRAAYCCGDTKLRTENSSRTSGAYGGDTWRPVTPAFCSMASWTACFIALRDSAEPSVGIRIFLNILSLLFVGIHSKNRIQGADAQSAGGERKPPEHAEPAPSARRDQSQREKHCAGDDAEVRLGRAHADFDDGYLPVAACCAPALAAFAIEPAGTSVEKRDTVIAIIETATTAAIVLTASMSFSRFEAATTSLMSI